MKYCVDQIRSKYNAIQTEYKRGGRRLLPNDLILPWLCFAESTMAFVTLENKTFTVWQSMTLST